LRRMEAEPAMAVVETEKGAGRGVVVRTCRRTAWEEGWEGTRTVRRL